MPDYEVLWTKDLAADLFNDITTNETVRRCIVASQVMYENVAVHSFPSPHEALHFVRKAALDCEQSCIWVDLQGCTELQNRKVLQLLFPDMQPSQLEMVLLPDACDVVELQPVKRQYVIGSLACSPGPGHSFSVPCAAELEGEGDVVVCSFACNERFLVTIHAAPFVGLAELLRHVEVEGGRVGQESLPGSRELGGVGAVTITGSAVLCALICFTCETYLPNPTGLISEVDCMDEMVMLVAPGKRDQTDLLRRMSVLRRRMSTMNAKLYMKEKLLQELMGPTMRTAFVSRDPRTVSAYREGLMELLHMLERLEIARDTLNHVNLNFVNGISMRISQVSSGFDSRMLFISHVAMICLPVELLASLFGMNCKVPWVASEYNNLNAFWGIIGVMLLWTGLCLSISVYSLRKNQKED